ncbi:glycosyltransferase family 9 protein [Algibacter sp. L4_22]|uniref:glycosyltransferase family 9 protein n=1 Tax=Algibacter sp. L4_22 TaxID=2942477 RepID=UPI00201B7A53|nr:glycosyltransferase family 9 protein [Algibacter sp. L4_22]MCL5127274.1 glycosyltransferase family 9 protein [Algibacter sp. L4_22]
MPKPKQHILVIRLSAMGDVAMVVSVIRGLVGKYPDVKITVLTREFFTPFFRGLPQVTVFPADLKGRHKGVFGLWKLSKELKAFKIDVIADLHNVLRSNILKLFFFGKRTVQIDKGRAEKKALVSGKKFQQLKTTHQRYADVFGKLGFPIDISNPTFPERVVLSSKLQTLIGHSFKKIIGIAPFAAHEGKMYPLTLMKKVIDALSKDYQIVLFGGGKKEVEALNDIENTFENVVSAAGKLSLNEELDLISNLDGMLAMDSGNAHMAAMMGVKTITIWGVTHPFAGFAPFNQPKDYALVANRDLFPEIPTSIFGNKYPENYKDAAGSISPETIISKVKGSI